MKWGMLSVGALVAPASVVEAFVGPNRNMGRSMRLFSATDTKTDDLFSAFADSLDEETLGQQFDSVNNDASSTKTTWQESLESLLSPTTPMAKRQIVLTDLLNANEAIQSSIQTALKEGKIDPLLTPTGKKLQDGTRAVARQITTDILPGIAEVAASSSSSSSSMNDKKNKSLLTRPPQEFTKIGNRVLNAISSQARKNLELLQGDLANPTRIPERLQKQTADFANEARNVFMETPEGLVGPPYKVLVSSSMYEIREYEAYTVASTSMSKVDEPYSMDDVASGGASFNALAAYLFGANQEEKSMEMTTPVATTSLGEMRFYLRNKEGDATTTIADFPEPLTEASEDDLFNSRGAVRLVEVPPARLAVARFTGFVTEGEVSRQKDALLSSLAMDGIEIDVPHGAVVPHVVFQYNPPYTIPMLRRNEIAIPVLDSYSPSDLEAEWGNLNTNGDTNDDDTITKPTKNNDDLSPSDVE